MKKGSIYLGRCLVNGKCYVGQTRKERPEDRITQHLSAKGKNKFHFAIRKHKPENFVFCWLRYKDVPLWLLDELEVFFISLYGTYKYGYNMTPGGGFRPTDDPEIYDRMLKTFRSDEHRKKKSETSKKMWQDPEYRKKRHEAVNDPEVKKKQSETSKKLWQDPDYRKKREDSDREAAVKRWQDPEFRKRHKEAVNDPDYRKKQSERSKNLWQDSDYRKKRHDAVNDPEVIKKASERSKNLWQDSAYRLKRQQSMYFFRRRKSEAQGQIWLID